MNEILYENLRNVSPQRERLATPCTFSHRTGVSTDHRLLRQYTNVGGGKEIYEEETEQYKKIKERKNVERKGHSKQSKNYVQEIIVTELFK